MIVRLGIFFYVSKCSSLFGMPSHSCASKGGGITSIILGHTLASSAFNSVNASWPRGSLSSWKIALAGHSGSHKAQSMQISGSITKKLGPSKKASTGQTATQSVYLHFIQLSVTTNVMGKSFAEQYGCRSYLSAMEIQDKDKDEQRYRRINQTQGQAWLKIVV